MCASAVHCVYQREDVPQGYALACQAVVEGDVTVHIPPQETLERHLTTDRTVAEVTVPAGYNPAQDQPLQRLILRLAPPSLDDQTDDWSRLQTAIRQETGITDLQISLPLLSKIGPYCAKGNGRLRPFSIHGNCPSCPPELLIYCLDTRLQTHHFGEQPLILAPQRLLSGWWTC